MITDENRATLAIALAPLTAVPVVVVGSIALRASAARVSASWFTTALFLAVSVAAAYVLLLVIVLPAHRRLRRRRVDSPFPYLAMGAACGAAPFAIYAAALASGAWPATNAGATVGVMLATLGVPVGVAVATTFWWIAVRE